MNNEEKYVTEIQMPFGIITIYSNIKQICQEVLCSGTYKTHFSNQNFNVFIGWNFENVDKTYRAIQMKKGVYLGHNIGKPCKIHICENNIHLYTEHIENYNNIFWSFVLKYILTKACLDENILHIKGSLIKHKGGQLVLLLGKGGSGKTTIGDVLNKYGYKIVSNTHCLIRDEYIWGINSWVRRRDGKNSNYTLAYNKNKNLDGNISKCYIVECNNQKIFDLKNVLQEDAYYYIKNFAAAISNYDLKEEVWDYMTSNFEETMDYLKREDVLIKNFLKLNIKKISIDSFDNHCVAKLADELLV